MSGVSLRNQITSLAINFMRVSHRWREKREKFFWNLLLSREVVNYNNTPKNKLFINKEGDIFV